MTPLPYAVLEAVVDAYRQSGNPVTPTDIAESLDVPVEALEEPIDSLRECELLEPTGGGYRPTVTAHELLELDVGTDDVLVVDIVEE